MIDRHTKTGKLCNLLTSRILQGEYKPGQRLPSVRRLAEAHGVSTMTAKLAVGGLRDGGFVRTMQGSGSYVVDVADRETRKKLLRIGLAYLDCYQKCPGSDTAHPGFIQWLRGAQDHFGHQRAMTTPFVYHIHELSEPSSAIRTAIEQGVIDGMVITGWLDPCEADYLDENKIPFVLVGSCFLDRDVATVKFDNVYRFKLLYEHLFNLGHRDILVLAYTFDSVLWHRRASPYVKAARSVSGGDFSPDQIIVIPNEDTDNPPNVGKYVSLALDRNPTAIIANDAMMAGRIVAEAAKRRIEVPRQLSIATSVNEFPDAHHINFTTTNSFALLRELTRIASELIERAVAGEDIRGNNIILMPSLTIGESTAEAL